MSKNVKVPERTLEEIRNTKSKRIDEQVFTHVCKSLHKVVFGPVNEALKEVEGSLAVRINKELVVGFAKFMDASGDALERFRNVPTYMLQKTDSVEIYVNNLSRKDLLKLGDDMCTDERIPYKVFHTHKETMPSVPYCRGRFPYKSFLLSESLRKDIVSHLLDYKRMIREEAETQIALLIACKVAGTTERLFKSYPELYPVFRSAGVLTDMDVADNSLPATRASEQVLTVAHLRNKLVVEGTTKEEE